MINLETLFKNHFDTKEISDDNLKKFSETHIERLNNNNTDGSFTAMITATVAAHVAYFGAMTSEDSLSTVQQGATVTINNIVKAFKKAVSQREGLVRGRWGTEAPQYQEFFPEGLTEYSNGTLANMELLMKRMATATTTYTTELGAEVTTEFTDFLDNFKAARAAQLGKIGGVKGKKVETSVKRDVIEIQLHQNLHKIADKFPGDVPKCMVFFDQSFLRDEKPENEDTPAGPTP
jgi:hypothetical protein